MKINTILQLFVFFTLSVFKIYALDVTITDKSLEAYLRGEYNRNFDFFGDISAIGDFKINDIFNVRSGFSYGRLAGSSDFKIFTKASVSPFLKRAIDFSLLWIYHGLFEYETHSNSIVPVVTYNWKKAGFSLGVNFRFTSFYGESSEQEYVLTYSYYYNFINSETLRIGIIWGNLGDFYARNMGAYSLKFLGAVRLYNNWTLLNEMELLQSGGIGLTKNFYGIALKTGVRYSW
jgi:hypothetical protein